MVSLLAVVLGTDWAKLLKSPAPQPVTAPKIKREAP
jgi:hypothetical protein